MLRSSVSYGDAAPRPLRVVEASSLRENSMKTVARIVIGSVVVFGIAVIGACSSDPKDPFDEWGAAQRYDEFVPATAQPVKQGTGTLTYTTPSNGVLYVLDTSAQVNVQGVSKPRVVVAGYLPSGTEVTFDPKEKRAYA